MDDIGRYHRAIDTVRADPSRVVVIPRRRGQITVVGAKKAVPSNISLRNRNAIRDGVCAAHLLDTNIAFFEALAKTKRKSLRSPTLTGMERLELLGLVKMTEETRTGWGGRSGRRYRRYTITAAGRKIVADFTRAVAIVRLGG